MNLGRLIARLNRPVTDTIARLPIRLELKLVVAFLEMVLLVVLLGLTGLSLLSDENERSEALIQTEARIDAYRQVEHASHAAMIALSSGLWMPGTMGDATTRMVERLGHRIPDLPALPGEDVAAVAALRRAQQEFFDIANRELALIRAGDIDLAGALQTEYGQAAAARLSEMIDGLVEKAEAEMAQATDAARATYRTSRQRLIAFLVAATLFGLYLAHTISTFVVGPLKSVGGRLSQIAAGDFTGRVEVRNRDEIGGLAENVNLASRQLHRLYTDLEAEKERSEEMLYHTLPPPIVQRIRSGESLIADRVGEATILFSDLAGFTELSDRLAPEEVLDVLDVLFSRFDILAERLGLEKIKTIGDGYMVAAGVLEPRPDHAAAIAEMGLGMRAATRVASLALGVIGRPLHIRIGINSGPLVAGVIGRNKLVYDIWGDTVNTASRMEKYGEVERIAVSARTRELLGNEFRFEPREPMEIKGKGEMETFFLERHLTPRRYHNMVARMHRERQAAD
ncbi:MAG TPA: adenylate/guanylate cyclase domain-containing protein [Stellaceae bacterium]|nr:adenylate/guanylate cyclase domain-containing protein [Stellaceae bacterium]